MDRYLCLHLHFYQPPRENPWLDEIEYQESAYPFHDWNERIDVECYRSNGASRILDAEGRVVDLANNYARTSFNFGPTLLSWLEDKAPETYERILEGDRISQTLFGGHGSAIAQAYNHMIMPLANRRDKETQVIWGLRDFERRFGRTAESMWLPETAVDIETLEILSAHGMKYVILAPRQARAVRGLDRDEPWQDVSGEKIDPCQPYLVRLPSGRAITAFFYNGPISKAVAFEGLLHNGETFAERLLSGFNPYRGTKQLLHIATDGETYGHHHRHGDMALAYALYHLEKNRLATITNYGQFLELNPPRREAQIYENSSWSCAHGVERWRENCGCNSGTKGDWHQKWRKPLRQALDHLRDRVEGVFESKLKEFVDDPWAVRDDYIQVVADRTLANVDSCLKRWCRGRVLNETETTQVLKALEAQRHLMLMYTSCGWFFDEISGLETVQNLQYAYRAMELGEAVFGLRLVEPFVTELESAVSNIPDLANGREVFERYVIPARVDSLRVGIHFAVASIFESFGESNEIFNNKVTLRAFERFSSGKARMACGHARIRSRTTLERNHILFGVIHLGDHNVSAGIKAFESTEEYETLLRQARSAFGRADFPATIRVFDRHFGSSTYSLKDLFKDEQRRIIEVITSAAMEEAEERFRRLYKNNYPLLCYLADLKFPIPKVFGDIAAFVDNRGLRKTLTAEGRVRTDQVRSYLDEAKNWGIPLDGPGLVRDLSLVLDRKMREFEEAPDVDRMEELLDLVKLDSELPLRLDLGPVQNWFLLWYKARLATTRRGPLLSPPPEELRFERAAQALGRQLRVKLPEAAVPEENYGEISLDLSASTAKELRLR
ncbi:MAG: DUF3536 domain-containing protein [Bdellovibrionales bacterium]